MKDSATVVAMTTFAVEGMALDWGGSASVMFAVQHDYSTMDR
jgi:hypothetical protein